jgi:hypothetical protein
METLGSFVRENKRLVKEWLETRLDIFKLKMIRSVSKSAGYLIWTIIAMLLFTLLMIFAGVTAGFWLSALTGSYSKGFGIVTLFILFLVLMLVIFRKTLFVNPVIRNLVSKMSSDTREDSEG